MQKCWEIDPTERPSFRSLTEKFETMLEDGVEYLNLNLHAVQNKAYFSNLNDTSNPSDESKQLNIPKYSNEPGRPITDPFIVNLLQNQSNAKCAEFNKLPIWQVSSPTDTASGGVRIPLPNINYQNDCNERRPSLHYEVPKSNRVSQVQEENNLEKKDKMHLSYIDMTLTKHVEEKPLLMKNTRSYDQLPPAQKVTKV